jgi:predicted nucleic acid-binding protein
MMLIDANILIYARVSSFVQDDSARDWFDQQLNALNPVGPAWVSLLPFYV